MCRICNYFSPRKFLVRLYLDLRDVEESFWEDESYQSRHLSYFEKAVLALEDRRFFSHCGIDIRSVAREAWRLLTFRKHGGASTIEMQLVRTFTGYREQKMRRKLYEMALAYLVTVRHGKLATLRAYLGAVYLGTGLSGAESTSYVLYSKPIDMLTLQEACQLAAMMVYPKPSVPSTNWQLKVQRRARYAEVLLAKFKF